MNDQPTNAARYEWIRQHGGCPFAEADPVWESCEELDAAIDERMLVEAMSPTEAEEYYRRRLYASVPDLLHRLDAKRVL